MRSKVTITVEDQANGTVKVVMTPSAETLLSKIASHGPDSLSAAEAYAMAAINRIRQVSKLADGSIIVPVPRIGRN